MNMNRKQKTSYNEDSLDKIELDTRNKQGVFSDSSASSEEKTKSERDTETLLESIVTKRNLFEAYKRVKKNKGSHGIDGMRVDELLPYLETHANQVIESLLDGTYKPKPVRRVEIPKPDGGIRLLGVPTVLDRMIQQAISLKLNDIFEPVFSDNSYGFRPKRSCHMALMKSKEFINEGNKVVVDMDLEKFFDRVNHDILMNRIARRVTDKRVLKLIRQYLVSGIMLNGIVVKSEEGTIQGGPLSPLLSNILLDDLDKELERRGHKFVRYADDSNIYLKSERAGQRVMESITTFLKVKLGLKVNLQKSAVDIPDKRKFLGFNLYHYHEAIRIRIAPQAIKRCKMKICEITSRSNGQNIIKRILKLNLYIRGWIQYFSLSDTPYILKMLEGWIRRRLRMCQWKQWKKIRTKYCNLIKLGLPNWAALSLANTRKDYWHIAGDSLNSALPNAYWANLGLMSLINRYCEIRSAL